MVLSVLSHDPQRKASLTSGNEKNQYFEDMIKSMLTVFVIVTLYRKQNYITMESDTYQFVIVEDVFF